jgi:hypothetical protein
MMQVKQRHKTYKVAVYFRDDEGVWHHHGTWEGEVASPLDAKCEAIRALADDRIDGWKAEILDSWRSIKP